MALLNRMAPRLAHLDEDTRKSDHFLWVLNWSKIFEFSMEKILGLSSSQISPIREIVYNIEMAGKTEECVPTLFKTLAFRSKITEDSFTSTLTPMKTP